MTSWKTTAGNARGARCRDSRVSANRVSANTTTGHYRDFSAVREDIGAQKKKKAMYIVVDGEKPAGNGGVEVAAR